MMGNYNFFLLSKKNIFISLDKKVCNNYTCFYKMTDSHKIKQSLVE